MLGTRGKIEDVIYSLFSSSDFSRHMKAANKRKQLAENRQSGTGRLSTASTSR